MGPLSLFQVSPDPFPFSWKQLRDTSSTQQTDNTHTHTQHMNAGRSIEHKGTTGSQSGSVYPEWTKREHREAQKNTRPFHDTNQPQQHPLHDITRRQGPILALGMKIDLEFSTNSVEFCRRDSAHFSFDHHRCHWPLLQQCPVSHTLSHTHTGCWE